MRSQLGQITQMKTICKGNAKFFIGARALKYASKLLGRLLLHTIQHAKQWKEAAVTNSRTNYLLLLQAFVLLSEIYNERQITSPSLIKINYHAASFFSRRYRLDSYHQTSHDLENEHSFPVRTCLSQPKYFILI